MEDKQRPKVSMLDRREFAEVVYRDLKESQRATFAVSAEYGRWLLASLFLMHGSALFGLFTFLGNLADRPKDVGYYAFAVWWFVAGILLAMLSGFLAWVNWSMHSNNYAHRADAAMLWDPEKWIGLPKHTHGITITNLGCIFTGFASALCTVGGADAIINGAYITQAVLLHIG